MPYSDRQLREIFHLLFLEKLLKIADPRLFVLKGGVNLRLFFKSPRYSEDMDLDVLGGSVTTLKKNGYRVLEDAALRRALQSFGVREIEINDPGKAKHTDTTQRFRVRLINQAGIALPTKVEFSRRRGGHLTADAIIGLEPASIQQALDNALALDYEDYAGQVLPFIDPEHLAEMTAEAAWADMRHTVLDQLMNAA